MNFTFQKNIKTILSVLSLVAISFVFTSCEDDPLTINFDTTVTESIIVHIDQGQDTVNDDVTLSLDNDDTHKYLDEIKDITITKLTYKIIDFSGDPEASVSGNLVADSDIVLSTEDFNVKNAFDAQTVYEVTDVVAKGKVETLLQDNHNVKIGIVGDSSAPNDSVDFKIEITAILDVKAGAL